MRKANSVTVDGIEYHGEYETSGVRRIDVIVYYGDKSKPVHSLQLERICDYSYSATRLRKDVYHLSEQVVDLGGSIEVKRKGKLIRIGPAGDASKLDKKLGRKRPSFQNKPNCFAWPSLPSSASNCS